jgi:hypothetical protein
MKFGKLWDLMAKEINYQRNANLDLEKLFDSEVSIIIGDGDSDETAKVTNFIGLCDDKVVFTGDKCE